MTTLPSDLDVARQLVAVRASVIEATHHVRSPKRSTRYRTTRNLIIAGAAIAALTAGAIVVIQYDQLTRATVVGCYPEPSLESQPILVSKEPGSSATPFELCELMWRNDLFDPANNNDPDPNDGTSPVPALVACTGRDGLAAVFPLPDGGSDKDFCETLGLAVWDSD
jgi:hypothetical protein